MGPINVLKTEPFAKFASRWDLLPGRVVIPGSAGVPPAQDLAGSWRLASQGWSVHLPTGAGAAPLQECGRDARAPRGKPMAGQVQIRILQKARQTTSYHVSSDPVRNAGQRSTVPRRSPSRPKSWSCLSLKFIVVDTGTIVVYQHGNPH